MLILYHIYRLNTTFSCSTYKLSRSLPKALSRPNRRKKRPPRRVVFVCAVRYFLEYEYELSTCLFFRIGSVAFFGFGSEGLHNGEHSVLSECVVDASAPRFNVVEVIPSPGTCGTFDVAVRVNIDVFNPSIPGFRSCEGSRTILQFTDPEISVVLFGRVCLVQFFVVAEQGPLLAEAEVSISAPHVVGCKASLAGEVVVVNASGCTVAEEAL